MVKTLLITGATGFIGRHFLKQLQSQFPNKIIVYVGYRQLVESSKNTLLNERPVSLNLLLDINLQLSVDVVVHVAGEKHDEDQMWEVNFEGTRRLLEWSALHGVKRFVYLSSVGVYGSLRNAGDVEASRAKCPQNTYESSKSAAEDLVIEKCTEYGLEYIILQPSNVIGWIEGKSFPLLSLMKMIKKGWFSFFGKQDVYFNYVAVEDVASALVAASVQDSANKTFILNSPVVMSEFLGWIAEELEVPTPNRRLPKILGKVIAVLADLINCLPIRFIPFGGERLKELTNVTYYDGASVCKSLGNVYPLGIELSVRELVRRYRKEGLL